MKVLFLLDSLGSGGAERSTAVLLPHLRERDVDASVVTLYRAQEGYEDEVRDAGFEVHVLPAGGFLTRVRALRRLIRTVRPDVVHTALFVADQIGRAAAIGTGTKVVTSLVNVPRPTRRSWDAGPPVWKVRVVNAIDVVTSQLLVDRFHAVSDGVAAAYRRRYRLPARKVVVVERGRDRAALGTRSTARRSAARAALGVGEGAPLVLAAGRHDHQKAHVDLVAAMRRVLDVLPEARLVVAGRDGEATPEIERELEQDARLRSAVSLLGFRDDVPDLLVAADLLALSSRFEGTAGIVLEAFAVGTPVVATELEGLAGIVVDGVNALTVSVGDVDRLAEAILRVLRDPELARRLASAGEVTFTERFTIERSADRMVAMYADLVGSST